jgi:hypothetical protein
MSKAAEAALLYEKSKTAMLLGLGFLAAKDPMRAVRIGVRVGAHLTKQLLVDTGAYSKIIKEEIIEPEVKDVAKWYAANKIPKGTVVTVSPWLPFVLFGGAIVRAAENLFDDDTDNRFTGVDTNDFNNIM